MRHALHAGMDSKVDMVAYAVTAVVETAVVGTLVYWHGRHVLRQAQTEKGLSVLQTLASLLSAVR